MADPAALLALLGRSAPAGASGDIEQMITSQADEIGVPSNVALSLGRRESGLNPRAESQDNGKGRGTAKGVYQLLDSTSSDLGVTDPFDPQQNIRAGLTNLKNNYDRFGSWDLALAAHHAGAGAVEAAGGIPHGGDANVTTEDYVRSIMDDAGDVGEAPVSPLLDLMTKRLNRPAQAEAAPVEAPKPPGNVTIGDVGRGLQDSLAYSAFQTVQGLKAAYADMTGDKALAAEAKNNIIAANELHEINQPHFANKLTGMLYEGAAGLASAAPVLAVGALNPAAGVTAFGSQAGASGYGKYRARGGTAGEAALGAGLEGGIAAATSFLPVKFLADKIGKAGMGEFVSGMLARDIPTMVAQGVANDLVDTSIANPHRTLKDFVSSLPENIGQSVISAMVFAAGTGAAHGAAKQFGPKPVEPVATPTGTAEPAPPAELNLVPKGEETVVPRAAAELPPPEAPNVELLPKEETATPAANILKAETVDDAIAAAQAVAPKLEVPTTETGAHDQGTVEAVAEVIAPKVEPKRTRIMSDAGVNSDEASWRHDYEAVKAPDGTVTLERKITTPEGERVEVKGKDGTWGTDVEPMTFRTVKFAAEEAATSKAQPKLNPVVEAALPRAEETAAKIVEEKGSDARSETKSDEFHDIYSIKPEAQDELANMAIKRYFLRKEGAEVPDLKRQSIRMALDRHLKALDEGRITPEEFALRIDRVNLAAKRRAAEIKDEALRERGADYIRERLLQAKRRGDLTEDAASMAEWFIKKNPSLVDTLGVSIRAPKSDGVAGRYDPFERVIHLMKGDEKSTVAVHEMLHHMERIMPSEMQNSVRSEYQKRLALELKKSDGPMRQYLLAALEGRSKEAAKMIQEGKVPYDAYQFLNPSEFWAVNLTRVMEARYRAGETGLWARTRQWLKEAIAHIKDAVGLSSDAPMLRALNDMLKRGDGSFKSERMLSDGAKYEDIQEEKKSIYSSVDPRRIVHGYSPYVGVEMNRLRNGEFGDAVAKAWAPGARGPGKETGHVIRANLGQQARERELAMTKLEKFAAMFDKFSPEDNFKFIDDIEHGRKIENPRLAEAATALRQAMGEQRDKVRALGKGKLENFNENYFPHIYKDPKQAEAFFRSVLSKRSLEGGKGFLKKRTYDYLSDAIKPKEQGGGGLTPLTDNPVEMVLLKLREMDRYIYGQKIFAELKNEGLVKFVRAGHEVPEGWQKVNDKIASVNSPAEEGGLIHRGDYYAPEKAATVINNHLSPGLAGNGFYDAFRSIGNAMNGAQLGLSLFHLGFTTYDSVVSKIALGVMQLRRGDVGAGLKNVAVGTLGGPTLIQPLMNLRKGDRLLKAYRGETSDPALAPAVEALEQAGAKVRDDLYRNTTVNAFKQAMRGGRYGEAGRKLLPTVLDMINKPVFEYLVPRQKFGVFYDLAMDAIKANPNMTLAEKRATFAKLWDSVDNRLGELVYDNVFWNRALKDGLMATTRSVGWNLGTFRELGGGVLDAKDFVTGKNISPRTAYVIALPFATAIFGSVLNYLYTGEPPQDLKDALFPRDGGMETDGITPTRKSQPSYVKDAAEYFHDATNFVKYGSDPTHTLKNKMHPLLSTISQMLNNEDYYGSSIRSPGDPATQQIADEAAYLIKQFTPFGIRNYGEASKLQDKQTDMLGYLTSPAFYGLAQAPGAITKSDEQIESAAVGHMKDALMRKFRMEIKENGIEDDLVTRMINAGLTAEERKMVLRSSAGTAPRARRPRVFGSVEE